MRMAVQALLVIATAVTAGGEPLDAAWRLAAELRHREAADAFAALGRAAPAGSTERHAADYGRAIALLNVQPRTASHLAEAEQLLTAVAAEAQGELQIEARYFLARLPQVHRFTPDYAEARQRYWQLFAEHPEHPLGAQAAVKGALLDLFAPPPAAAADPAARVVELSRLAPTLSDPAAQAHLHLILAEAVQRHRLDPALRREHLAAALASGWLRPPTAADTCATLALSAEAAGDLETARHYLARFVREFPRDHRTAELRARLAELEPPPAPPSP